MSALHALPEPESAPATRRPGDPELLQMEQAADLCGVSVNTLYNAIRQGHLPPHVWTKPFGEHYLLFRDRLLAHVFASTGKGAV